MRTLLVLLTILVVTPYYFAIITLAAIVGIHGERSPVAWGPQAWSSKIAWAMGIRTVLHGFDRLKEKEPRVLVANHVSWADVFSLASALPRFAFVAKAELANFWFFGRAARASGQVFIDRANRKAAFAAYEKAAIRIREGTTVVIFPEGTRGLDYMLRPFKKGPFVLAIAAQAPVIPMLIHGTIHIHPKGGRRVRSGVVNIHALEAIPTAGMTYDDRDALARRTYETMRVAQRELYGIESPAWDAARAPSAGAVAD